MIQIKISLAGRFNNCIPTIESHQDKYMWNPETIRENELKSHFNLNTFSDVLSNSGPTFSPITLLSKMFIRNSSDLKGLDYNTLHISLAGSFGLAHQLVEFVDYMNNDEQSKYQYTTFEKLLDVEISCTKSSKRYKFLNCSLKSVEIPVITGNLTSHVFFRFLRVEINQ